MGHYACTLCEKESCYECFKNDESLEGYFRREGYYKGLNHGYERGKKGGYEKGYYEGFKEGCKKGYEKGKSEGHGLICTFAKPEGTFCKFLKRPCDGCDLSCNYLCVHDELNFLDEIQGLGDRYDKDSKV